MIIRFESGSLGGSKLQNLNWQVLDRMISSFACVLFVALFLSGCASPEAVSATSSNADKQPHCAGEPTITFNEPISRIHRATLEALANLNCATKEKTEFFIKGKFGTGEIIKVSLRASGPDRTQLWITSHRTYVGGAWQEDRCNDVIWAIKQAMSLERTP